MQFLTSYTDGHGTLQSVASAQTSAMQSNSLPIGSVTASGIATQNQTLTASNTLADLNGLGTISYQWQSLTGSTWSNIARATAQAAIVKDQNGNLPGNVDPNLASMVQAMAGMTTTSATTTTPRRCRPTPLHLSGWSFSVGVRCKRG